MDSRMYHVWSPRKTDDTSRGAKPADVKHKLGSLRPPPAAPEDGGALPKRDAAVDRHLPPS